MPENITTVLNLPEADFGSAGFPNPSDNRVYVLQGEGSDRDRKAALGDLFDWLVGYKAMTSDAPEHRVGDIVFKIEETRGGKLLTAYIMDGRTLEKPSVTGGMSVSGGIKTDTIEGTNQGQGSTKYLVLGNTTVTGDLDAKGKAMLGNSMLVADPDEQTLESTVPLDFGNGYKAGKELVKTEKVETGMLSTTGAVTAGGKLTVKNAASVSGQLDVSGPANLSGGANVGDLKITGSVQFPSGNGLIPTLVYDIDSTRGDILSNYIGTDRNVFILLVNADSTSHTISYSSQEAAGSTTRNKQIAVANAGLFYIDGNGNAAPVS